MISVWGTNILYAVEQLNLCSTIESSCTIMKDSARCNEYPVCHNYKALHCQIKSVKKEIMGLNFPNLGREIDIQIVEVQRSPKKMNLRNPTQKKSVADLSAILA